MAYKVQITAERAQYDAQMDAAAAKAMSTGQAIASNMRAGAVQMAQSFKESNDKMNASFDSVKAGIERVRGAAALVAAVVGGGSLFGKSINQTAELTAESQKLSRMLGIETEAATVLRLALDDINVTSDDYLGMVGKMTMKLREGEERFNALGVKTRDANGNLLDTDQITRNAVKALEGFREGTDRNLAASEMFGKGWNEVMKLMRLTPELMEAARVKAEELQLTVGPKGAERARLYKLAVNDVKDVAEALANRIGQAVMPALTDMGNWLAEMGPTAVTVMRGAIGGLMTAFYGLRNGVIIVWEVVKAAFSQIAEFIIGPIAAIDAALRGNFAEARARLAEMPKNISSAWESAGAAIIASSEKTRERVGALWSMDAEQGGQPKGKTGTRQWKEASTTQSRVSSWDGELAAARDAYDKQQMEQGSFQQFTLAMERDFWKSKMALSGLSKEETIAVSKKYYDAERALRKQAFDLEIADIKAQGEAFKKGSVERIAQAGEAAVRIGQKYGVESAEYRAAMAEMYKLAQERAEQQRQLREIEIEADRAYQLQRVALEEAQLETLEKLGIIKGKQKIARLQELKDIEFAIELRALQDKAALLEQDEVAHAQAMERIAELRRRHELDKQKLDAQGAIESKKTIDMVFDPISKAMDGMLQGVSQGTQTWQQMVRNAAINTAMSYGQTLLKMGLEWIKIEILKTQATTAGVAARTAAEAAGGATSTAITGSTAVTNIGASAWEAAAGAYKAIVGIPVVGPVLAPAMAIAAAAAVMGFIGNIASASGGFDIPFGMNPMTQLHQREMVLPQHIADPLRETLAGGRGLGGGTTFNVSAFDGKSVERLFENNAGPMARALERMGRNNVKSR